MKNEVNYSTYVDHDVDFHNITKIWQLLDHFASIGPDCSESTILKITRKISVAI